MSRILEVIDNERGPFEMVPHWLLDGVVSSGAVHLWLVLRKHGDETRTSFPGRSRLAESLLVSKSTITRLIDELRAAGALCYQQRKSADGDYTSNEYHVHWYRKDQCTWFTRGLGGPPTDYPSPPTDHGGPQVVNIKRLSQRDLVKKENDRFDDFWQAYPKKVARKKAHEAWVKSVKSHNRQMLIDAAKRYADNPKRDPDFTLNPTTWLNQERWLDEPPQAARKGGPVTVMDLYAAEPCEHGDPMGESRCALCRRK